eukprot:m.58509 g.58509  ORF g.58509 m.58509 type:complete len:93 (+) comp15657_c0_seq1:1804-2082(+)
MLFQLSEHACLIPQFSVTQKYKKSCAQRDLTRAVMVFPSVGATTSGSEQHRQRRLSDTTQVENNHQTPKRNAGSHNPCRMGNTNDAGLLWDH